MKNEPAKQNDSISTFWKRYRIVTDNYSGYNVQLWRWWWPFWRQIGSAFCSISNTQRTIKAARKLAANHCNCNQTKL